ncbi:hypothetical protein [Campylobacter sp.]|nr:hypothetical protein [Campylobacter sp.]MDD7703915.1 hypothetical protein [Campylobacteraceae bacterium]MDY2635330.1 hypothetical protein [Campylobacter sp.]
MVKTLEYKFCKNLLPKKAEILTFLDLNINKNEFLKIMEFWNSLGLREF